MKRSLRLLFALFCIAGSTCVAAPADPPSDGSIEEYLRVSNAQQLVDTMKLQMGAMMKNSLQQATQGKALTPQRQAILDHMMQQMSDLMTENLNWDTLKPMYMRVYHDSFTQSEIDGIIRFYKTSAGKALINKMPIVMQNVMNEMQGMLKPMQQKMLQIEREAAEKIKATPDQ